MACGRRRKRMWCRSSTNYNPQSTARRRPLWSRELRLLMATGGGGGGSPAANECGALRASAAGRTRSYGSTARRPSSPAWGQQLEHRLQPGDTLQGLALRYGVTTEQIKRANRLYTSDSIFLKEVLMIPVAGKQQNNGMLAESPQEGSPAGRPEDSPTPEMSASDFLRRIDAQITQSKAAALKKLGDDGDRFDGSSLSVQCRPVPTSQRALLGPARLTKTTRVTSLQDTEDEIFHL